MVDGLVIASMIKQRYLLEKVIFYLKSVPFLITSEYISKYVDRLFKEEQLQLYRRLVAMRAGHRGRYLHRYSCSRKKYGVNVYNSLG